LNQIIHQDFLWIFGIYKSKIINPHEFYNEENYHINYLEEEGLLEFKLMNKLENKEKKFFTWRYR
jgi:hypothetical protein